MKLNALGIFSSDIEESIRFYQLLGVPFPDYNPDEGHYDADLGNGMRLMLDSHAVAASFIDDFTPPEATGAITMAVECDSPAAVDEAFASITAAGFSGVREPFDAFWGQRYATVEDPDGNPVDLYAASENT